MYSSENDVCGFQTSQTSTLCKLVNLPGRGPGNRTNDRWNDKIAMIIKELDSVSKYHIHEQTT